VIEPEEEHRVRQPQAYPEDAEQRSRDRQRDVPAQRPHDRHQRRQEHGAGERQHHLELVSVGRGGDHARQADEAGQRQRVHRGQQPVQLVQRDEPEPGDQQREESAVPGEHDQDRDRRPWRRNQDPGRGRRAPPRSSPALRRPPPCLRHYLPPNRYSREP
jgi:hypothetical protein